MAIQFDDSILTDMGLQDATDDQKKAFLQQFLETLELRIGTRLTEDLTDEQLDEFEKIAPSEGDSPEVAAEKEEQASQWLQSVHPNYEGIIAEEMDKLKRELTSSMDAILGPNAS